MKRSKDSNYFSLLCQQCDMVNHMLTSTKDIVPQSLHKVSMNKISVSNQWKKAQDIQIELWKMLRNEFLPPINREDIYHLSSQIQRLMLKIYYYAGLRERNKVNTYTQEDKLIQHILEQNRIHKILIKELENINKSKILDSEYERRKKEIENSSKSFLEIIMNDRYMDGKEAHLYKERLQLIKDIYTANEEVGNTIEYIVLRNS